jgi:predicted enzyme related to lactoylglutathione lyase
MAMASTALPVDLVERCLGLVQMTAGTAVLNGWPTTIGCAFRDWMIGWREAARCEQQDRGEDSTMSIPPSNMVTWFQLPVDDMERAWAFYSQVFGWRPDTVYADEKRLGAINGDFAPRSAELPAPRLVIRVDDLDAALAAVTDAGGVVITEPTAIPGFGMVYATFRDSEGNLLNVVADAE